MSIIPKLTYRQLNIITQVIFWLSYLCLMVFTFATFLNFDAAFSRAILLLIFNMVLVYIHLYYLMPRYFELRRFTQYMIGLLLLITIISSLRLAADALLVSYFKEHNISLSPYLEKDFSAPQVIGDLLKHEYQQSANEKEFFRKLARIFFVRQMNDFLFTAIHIGSIVITSLLLILITIPLRLMEIWHQQRVQRQKLQSQQLEAELKFLKAQVNPHFLFNTLNNIYTLALTESQQAAPMIMKLSEMMRYMIYECNTDWVYLEREVEYLHNYIGLQQLKTQQTQQISFEINGNMKGLRIPPMLFVPLLENAFKHGMLDNTRIGWLQISLNISEVGLQFSAKNNYQSGARKDEVGGIGLDNIQQRLQLIYPDSHDFHVHQSEEVFEVVIKLKHIQK